MALPEVIVFDLGKVLLDFDYSKAARKLSARSAMNVESVQKFINQSPLLFRYETGLITREQFYSAICEETGFNGDFTEFSEIFGNIFEPIGQMIEVQNVLKKKGFPTFIFSNTNDLAIQHIRRTYPFFGNFDGYIFSYEHGSMKPHAKLYDVVEKHTGRSGNKILYLDDRPENIAAGVERGWQVILQETPEKTLQALCELKLID